MINSNIIIDCLSVKIKAPCCIYFQYMKYFVADKEELRRKAKKERKTRKKKEKEKATANGTL